MVKEVWRSIKGSKYEISNLGQVRKFYKYKYRYLKTFRKGSIQIIKLKINGKAKDYNVAKLVVETFCRKLKDHECIYHKNELISDNRLSNLRIMTRSEAGKITGPLSRQKTIVLLDADGVIKEVYKGTREAEKKLYISRQTVSDYCNHKVKKRMFNIEWADKLI